MPNYPVHRQRAKEFSWRVMKIAFLFITLIIISTNEIAHVGWGVIAICLIGISAFIGVLLPDIDHHSSIPRRNFERVTRFVIPLLVGAIALRYLIGNSVGISQEIRIFLLIGLLFLTLKFFLNTPSLVGHIMPAHRKLLHRPYFWTITGATVATLLFIVFYMGPDKLGSIPIIPFEQGTSAATYTIGGIALATGGAVTLGAHQHLEQDGVLHSEFNPGPTIRAESELMKMFQWLATETAYRFKFTYVEEAAGTVLSLIIPPFRQLSIAIAESIAKKSLSSFRKRLTLRDLVTILVTVTVVVLLVYLFIRFIKWLLSDSSEGPEIACPSSLNEKIAELEGTNGSLEVTYESVTVDREQWENRHHGYKSTTIPLEDISAFNVGSPGIITDGYIHVETQNSHKPRANVFAYRNQTTVKCSNQTKAILWTSEVDEIRKWKRSLSSSPDPLTYLAAYSCQ